MKISVRNLVEFILRSGDITTSESGLADPDAMQEGARIHKKLQRQMGALYQAEVSLSHTLTVQRDDVELSLCVEGRADGIFPLSLDSEAFGAAGSAPEPESSFTAAGEGMAIDEIKGIYRRLSSLTEPVPVHKAQAMCYAYIYALEENLPYIGIRMTYCHIPTEEIKYFREILSFSQLEAWFLGLVQEYAKWVVWQLKWLEARNASLHTLEFPFPYREGQRELVRSVYLSILREKRLYIQAPTGVGKTLSALFPAAHALGEGLAEKIFYLTAKTVTRTVAEEGLHILERHGLLLKRITLTAKEKICILDRPQCNPDTCPRALGHYDRINDAVFDLLTNENHISREVLLDYAEKYQVCPFEMSLDTSIWCDAVIGDYNYAFDPTASLKRFFANDTKNPYLFLIDEAHNLVDRAREMFSASLVKEELLAMKKLLQGQHRQLARALDRCNREMLALKRNCDTLCKYEPLEIEPLVLKLLRLAAVYEEFLQNREEAPAPLDSAARERLLDFYFRLRSFLNIYDLLDEKYVIYSCYQEDGSFLLRLQCMDPSANLNDCLNKGRSAVFFSATLLPISYYREQLAGREEDYAIYAPSPFPADHRLLMIGRDVSTKYTRRGPVEYAKIADYILSFVSARTGNYMIFFPSYQMLLDIRGLLDARRKEAQEEDDGTYQSAGDITLLTQESSMTEEEREDFLSHFQEAPKNTTLGLCVMGGIFGEGIDLKDSRLIGAVIVGTGLPMVCTENELFREYFDAQSGAGFDYAYLYPGMNKVLQAAGRVIRTVSDRGAILLLDERFLQNSYQRLFPREWYPYEIVNLSSMPEKLSSFWNQAEASLQKE